MLVVESNLSVSSTSSSVLDSGSSAHICTSMQGLIDSRGLRHGVMILWISNGAKIAVEAIGIYSLRLPPDFGLILKDCYFVFIASRN